MAEKLIPLHGPSVNAANYVGTNSEISVDSGDSTLLVHDGVTPGGHKMAKKGDLGTAASKDIGTDPDEVQTNELKKFKYFDSLTSAVSFVSASPGSLKNITTASYRSKTECTALGIDYPDGGGADYVVGTGFGVADGGSIIDTGTKQLQLTIEGGSVDVRTFSGVSPPSDWAAAFLAAADFARAKGILLTGSGLFNIASDVEMRRVSIDFSAADITTFGTAMVIIGGDAGKGSNPEQSMGDVRNNVLITDPELNLNPSIRVVGAKGQTINVRFCDYLQFYQSTDPATYPSDASQAYSTFNLGYCIKVSIDTDPLYDSGGAADGASSANQWFNENKINLPRCKGFYMRGSYKHNNNVINGGTFEGTAYLIIESGNKNHFKNIRFEGSTYTLTLGTNTLGNTVERSWFGSEASFWLIDYTDAGQLNNVSSTTVIRANIDKVHEVSVDDIQHDGFNGNYNKRQPSKDKLKSSISFGILTESDFISVAETDYLFFTGELYTAADPLDSSTWGSAIVRVDFYDIRYKPVTIDESWFESFAFSKTGDNRLESSINGFGQTRLGLVAGSSDIKYCKVKILSSSDRTKDLMRKISVKRFSNRNPIIEYFSDKAGLSENYKTTSLPTKAIMPLGTSIQKTDGLARYVCTHSILTELSANGSGVSISVLDQFDSASGSTLSGDLIGVELDNNEVHWTTVSSISGLNITLTAGIPSAASSGASCYITRMLTV